jgi:hypothetical protein
MPNNTGIGPEKPKEKYIDSEKQPNKGQDIRSNDIIESRSVKDEIG